MSKHSLRGPCAGLGLWASGLGPCPWLLSRDRRVPCNGQPRLGSDAGVSAAQWCRATTHPVCVHELVVEEVGQYLEFDPVVASGRRSGALFVIFATLLHIGHRVLFRCRMCVTRCTCSTLHTKREPMRSARRVTRLELGALGRAI
jgi:hypothetical protein